MAKPNCMLAEASIVHETLQTERTIDERKGIGNDAGFDVPQSKNALLV